MAVHVGNFSRAEIHGDLRGAVYEPMTPKALATKARCPETGREARSVP